MVGHFVFEVPLLGTQTVQNTPAVYFTGPLSVRVCAPACLRVFFFRRECLLLRLAQKCMPQFRLTALSGTVTAPSQRGSSPCAFNRLIKMF